jgi:PTH1 family peptidyl-tRNA hydrolase
MKLIVGLGNPGKAYAVTRHNAGFWLVDVVAEVYGFPAFTKKFQGEFAKGEIGGVAVGLLKPHTFMNLSGSSVQGAATFFKVKPVDILVVHDELDLAVGELRAKVGGGDAGHNGLKSITLALGAGYGRLRIGIGRPEHKEQVSDYVLHAPGAKEADVFGTMLGWLAENTPALLENPVTALAKYPKPL